ncbi:hypothetical protein CW748_10085 [Alteromonadales bacterium alter-6D02]|nr:hypothetical protein CW748_10085 [Alteromonadales bacterium alter-6D02]
MMQGWDLTITKQFCQALDTLVGEYCANSWALMADLSHWCLTSEDAYMHFAQSHKGCIRQGLRYQVVILPRSSLKRWRIKSFIKDDYLVKSYLADNEQEAFNWLAGQGFNVRAVQPPLLLKS